MFRGEQVSVSDAEAQRLVKLGAAKIISSSADGPDMPPSAPHSAPDPDRMQDTTGDSSPADGAEVARLERMTKADLEQMALDIGVDISGAKNNRERAELIAAAEMEEDGEIPEDPEDGDIVR